MAILFWGDIADVSSISGTISSGVDTRLIPSSGVDIRSISTLSLKPIPPPPPPSTVSSRTTLRKERISPTLNPYQKYVRNLRDNAAVSLKLCARSGSVKYRRFAVAVLKKARPRIERGRRGDTVLGCLGPSTRSPRCWGFSKYCKSTVPQGACVAFAALLKMNRWCMNTLCCSLVRSFVSLLGGVNGLPQAGHPTYGYCLSMALSAVRTRYSTVPST